MTDKHVSMFATEAQCCDCGKVTTTYATNDDGKRICLLCMKRRQAEEVR